MKGIICMICCVWGLISCKKDADEIAPSIELLYPTEAFNISLPDTIGVSAIVRDNLGVKSVRLSIIDESNVTVGPSFVNTFSDAEVNFNVAFVIDDLDLTSGNYFLVITASDGENESKQFILMNLVEIPKVFSGLLYSLVQGDESAMHVELEDGTESTLGLIDSQGIFCVQNRNNRVFISQDEERALGAFDYTDNWNALWSYQLPNLPSGQSIKDMDFDDQRREVIVQTGSGDIYIIGFNGVLKGVIDIESTEICQDLVINEDVIWLGVKTTGGQNKLVQVFRDSGARGTELPLPNIPESMIWFDEQRIVISLTNGDVIIKNIQTGTTLSIDLPGDTGVLEHIVSNGEIYALKSDQLYKVTSSYAVQPLYTSEDLRDIAVDEVNGRLFLAEGNNLKSFNMSPWFNLNEVQLIPEFQKSRVLYNK